MGEQKQSDSFLKLDNLKIMVQGKPMLFSDYEKINVKTITDILENKHKHNIIIHPGGSVIDLLTLIFSATRMCVYNMTAPENFILDSLTEGDIVLIDSQKARYRGIVSLDYMDGEKIALQYRKKGSMYYIPIEQSYRITPYKGNSGNLNKMEGKKNIRKSITKNVISQLSGIDIQDMIGTFKYSSVVACPETDRIEGIIKNTELVCNGEKSCFTNVYPSAYYSSADNYRNFAGNVSKAEPVLKFVSRIAAAGDLIRRNRDIKQLIIFGEKIYLNYLGELDWMLKKKTLEKIIIILDWESVTSASYFLNNEFDFSWYVWGKNDILDNVNLYEDKSYEDIADIIKEQDEVMNCYVDTETEIITVGNEDHFFSDTVVIRDMLYEISRASVADEIKEDFLRICHSLLILFEQSCFPICYLDKAIEEKRVPALLPNEKINRLKELYNEFKKYLVPEDIISKLDRVIKLLQEFRERLLHSNPKWDLLYNRLCTNQDCIKAVVVYKSYYVDIIKECLYDNGLTENICLFSVTKFHSRTVYDEIIFTGVYSSNKEKIIDSCHGELLVYLLYNSEKEIYAWKIKKSAFALNKIQDKNNFSDRKNDYEDTISDITAQRYVDLDDLMLELIKKKHIFIHQATMVQPLKALERLFLIQERLLI